MNLTLRMLAGGILSAMCAGPAAAHVKWFNADYCVNCSPETLDHVINKRWIWLLVLFALLSLCAFIIDRLYTERVNRWVDDRFQRLKVRPEEILRVGLGVFLLCLWTQSGILLTPELQTSNPAVPWFQLALAAATLSWKTTWIACCGVFVLFVLAVEQYGFFHLLDYPIFLGIAAYLMIHSLRISRLKPYAGSVLVTAVSGTLLWASFEKWAYWVWTMPLVAHHPDIDFGFNPKAYIVLGGFVEFFLAYFLLSGRFFGRLAAIGLLLIFLSAIFDFGKIDAIGHSLIILSLVVIIIQGAQPVTDVLSWRQLGITRSAFANLGILGGVFGTYLISYFGLHHLIYG